MSKVPPLQFRREDIPDLSTGERTDRLLRGLNAFGASAEKALNGGLTLAGNFKAFAKDVTIRGGAAATAAVTDYAWHNLSLTADFTNYGTGYPTTRYRRDSDGIVYVQVAVTQGGAGNTIGTLPAGYRPSAIIQILGTHQLTTGTSVFEVTSGGVINITATVGVNPKIFNVSFPADDYTAPAGTSAVNSDWPIRVKNTLGTPPRHVLVTRLVSLAGDKETPLVTAGLSWSADKDQVSIHSIGNVSPGAKFRATILVIAE